MEDETSWSRPSNLSVIAAGVENLSDTDRLILFLRFGRDLTQSEIARRIGTSQMQVSRLLRSAIEKIRRASGEIDPPVLTPSLTWGLAGGPERGA